MSKGETMFRWREGISPPRRLESDNSVRMVRELGEEVDYLRFRDEGHSIRRLENRIIAYPRIAGFLERALEGGVGG